MNAVIIFTCFQFQILDAIVCYNCLLRRSLQSVILTLSNKINDPEVEEEVWKIMRNILGTHLGHSVVQSLLFLLQENSKSYLVLRGAALFIGRGLWDLTKAVPSLTHKPNTVLLFFKKCVPDCHPIVALEILLCCSRLVKKIGHELDQSSWDVILYIIDCVTAMMGQGDKIGCEQSPKIFAVVEELLTFIERLYQSQAYSGSASLLFATIEKLIASRPEESVLMLLDYKMDVACSKSNTAWVHEMSEIIHLFLDSGLEAEIQLKALEKLLTTGFKHLRLYEDEIINTVFLPHFPNVIKNPSTQVQEALIRFIGKLCLLGKPKTCSTLLVLIQPFLVLNDAGELHPASTVNAVVQVYISVFQKFRLLSEVNYITNSCYDALCSFIKCCYSNGLCSESLWEARHSVLKLVLLENTADSSQSLVFGKDPSSPRRDSILNDKDTSMICDWLPVQEIFSIILLCLENEVYWTVLETAFKVGLYVFRFKTLVLSAERPLLDRLVEVCCLWFAKSDKLAIEHLVGFPNNYKTSDLKEHVLSFIAAFIPHHELLSTSTKRRILVTLDSGFSSKNSKRCICLMTMCIVEFGSETLIRFLPCVLLRLSQMSATVHHAPFVLELLSILSHKPQLFQNFAEEQYKSVFAIALHYTASKFSLFIVSLAQHVVTMWYVKCRLNMRQEFVQFITRTLQVSNPLLCWPDFTLSLYNL